MSDTNGVAGEQLLGYIERVERLDEEIKVINDDKKDIYACAKGNGFDVKMMKKVIQLRRKSAHEREEEDAVLQLYWDAVQNAEAQKAANGRGRAAAGGEG